MRYAALSVFAVLGAAVFVAMVAYLLYRQVTSQRRFNEQMRREEARDSAVWEDHVYQDKLHTVVTARRMARHGSWSEEVDRVLVGQVSHGSENYKAELEALWDEARERAYTLNFGPIL